MSQLHLAEGNRASSGGTVSVWHPHKSAWQCCVSPARVHVYYQRAVRCKLPYVCQSWCGVYSVWAVCVCVSVWVWLPYVYLVLPLQGMWRAASKSFPEGGRHTSLFFTLTHIKHASPAYTHHTKDAHIHIVLIQKKQLNTNYSSIVMG